MTTLIEREEQALTRQPEHDQRVETYQRRNRTLTILAAVMAVVLVAMAAWIVYDATRSSDVAPTAEVEQVLDDYVAAWNDYDGEAFLAIVTDSYRFESPMGSRDAEGQARTVAGLESSNWHVATVGEPVVAGDGPWYTAQVNRITGIGIVSEGIEGISVTKIIDDGGTLKVANHVYTGQL